MKAISKSSKSLPSTGTEASKLASAKTESFQTVFPDGAFFQISHSDLQHRKTRTEQQRMPENTCVFKHFDAFCPGRS